MKNWCNVVYFFVFLSVVVGGVVIYYVSKLECMLYVVVVDGVG